MIMQARHQTRRHGHTAVEFSLIAIILLMLLFGIMEYGRYLYTQNILNNAAREGARFCVVNINNFASAAAANTAAHTYINNYLGGTGNQLHNWNPAVGAGYIIIGGAADPNGRWAAGGDGTWTSCTFGGNVGPPLAYAAVYVTITGTYNPVLPSFLYMPSALTMNATSTMYVEAN
jgi:Flp pilus assembly protein TadG